MKKAILYLLLFAYIVSVGKPLLPVLADLTAHIFWYSEHIATVHYENGKYHVHAETLTEARKNYPGKDASLPKAAQLATDHIVTRTFYHFSLLPVSNTHYPGPTQPILQAELQHTVPPPKV